MAQIKIELWPLDKIHPYPGNAKTHMDVRIRESIKSFGIDQPIVVDKKGTIIKGHGRYEAAKALGMKDFPVIVRKDLDKEMVRLSRIADNRSAEGDWDFDKLSKEMAEIETKDLEDIDLSQLGITPEWYGKPEIPEALSELKLDPKKSVQPALDKNVPPAPKNVSPVPSQTKDPAIKSEESETMILVVDKVTKKAWEAWKLENKLGDDSMAFRKMVTGQ